MQLKNKIIFLISRESWGGMLMSKQHYALELAKRGNTVYFINYPDLRKKYKRGSISLTPTDYRNIISVNHRLVFPFFLKDKSPWLYKQLIKFHIKKLVNKIGQDPDIVWTFDVSNALPLKFFPKAKSKIYMPVDGPFGLKDEVESTKGANLIVSVTKEILETYKHINLPQFQLNHGVSDIFINENVEAPQNSRLRIGYSGSLVRNDLDTENFLTIISSHTDKIFDFWGEYDYQRSSIHLPQDVGEKAKDFIEKLKTFPNVKLHGTVRPEVLAKGLKDMDILLICYKLYDKEQNLRNDQNHHKVLEYLGTGKVIVTSYMSVYHTKYPGLMIMSKKKHDNGDIVDLFNEVVERIDFYNSRDKQEERIKFAKQFTYSTQVECVENFIGSAINTVQ